MIASRLVAIPLLAAVGYEILRLGARHRRNPIIKAVMFPGILVQMITTKRPDDDMIEVAITSMQEALVADGNAVPEGSTPFDREPLDLGATTDATPVDHPGRAADHPAAAVTSPSPTTDADEPPAIA